MAAIYARRIQQSLMILEEVPKKWRDQVAELLGEVEGHG